MSIQEHIIYLVAIRRQQGGLYVQRHSDTSQYLQAIPVYPGNPALCDEARTQKSISLYIFLTSLSLICSYTYFWLAVLALHAALESIENFTCVRSY